MSAAQSIAGLCGSDRREVVLARSASAAFLGLLLACDLDPGAEVILPVSACQTMVNAVLLAGAVPVFADCGPHFELAAADAAARLSGRTRLLVFHHPFGRACDLAPLRSLLASRPRILLVEDCSHCPGGEQGGRIVGSDGEVALLSFGRGKPLDAGGGGALLIHQTELARAVIASLRVGRPGWRDDERLGIDSTLNSAEERRILKAVEVFHVFSSQRIAKVERALGLPGAPGNPSRANLYHRLVLEVGEADQSALLSLDPVLCQRPSPSLAPFAAPFLERRYRAVGRADLWDPRGTRFPTWRRLAATRLLVRTGRGVSEARLKRICKACAR